MPPPRQSVVSRSIGAVQSSPSSTRTTFGRPGTSRPPAPTPTLRKVIGGSGSQRAARQRSSAMPVGVASSPRSPRPTERAGPSVRTPSVSALISPNGRDAANLAPRGVDDAGTGSSGNSVGGAGRDNP